MSKRICKKCHAINAELSESCHCCCTSFETPTYNTSSTNSGAHKPKPDIITYEWSDEALSVDEKSNREVSLPMNLASNDGWFYIRRSDAIALAKHFEIKQEEME